MIATGETHTVRELCEVAFGLAGLDWERYVRIDATYLRPTEVEALWGDATKARERLGWEPRVRFAELVRIMLEHDVAASGQDPKSQLATPVIWNALGLWRHGID